MAMGSALASDTATSCHNELCYSVADLASKFYTPTHMHYNSLINPGCAMWIDKDLQTKSNPPNNLPRMVVYSEQKGELLIRYHWDWGMDCILDMSVVNMEASAYLQNNPEKSLGVAERYKNSKYLDSFLQQSCHFSPSVVSVNVIMGTQAEATLARKTYSCIWGFIRSMAAIPMVRSTHLFIRGS